MVERGILLLLLVSFVTYLVVKLLRRSNRRTENADGLLIEQARRRQAYDDRCAYNSAFVHHAPLPHSSVVFRP
ncbi:hypothetical protein OG539_03210 [Actinacidiphila glaucinigra]|uniref:hypothetical protein n=1 Tax=Actinacidiphila glaucinigra TaxID=235986 RepID=UPI002DDB8B1F|nr:hypothetical protein [Actinacidiphila glaucinigra]WSD64580.1 hypothetical protein OIE69_39655 [Actinacidiphila glaucinigra]